MTNLQVKGTADIATTQTEIKSKLQADKSYDARDRAQPGHRRGDGETAIKGASSSAKLATFDLNPEVIKRHQGGRHRVRRRPAAVPAGLPADRVPEALQDERQHRRRRPAGPHRPGLRRQVQRRDRREARRRRHALIDDERPASPCRRAHGRRRRRRRPSRSPTSDWRTSALMARILRRPEIGALLAAIVVAIFFWTQNSLFLQLDGIANWTDVASTIGIPAVVVALLMIGGEFDLSAGVMTGSAGLMMGILATKVGHEHLARDRADADRRDGGRLPQRLHGHADQAAELHRHAGDVLHPAGRQPRRHEGDHQPGVGQRASTPRRATTAPTRSSAAASGVRTTSGSPCCGGSSSPRSATWVLTRTRVGNWIFGVGGDAERRPQRRRPGQRA